MLISRRAAIGGLVAAAALRPGFAADLQPVTYLFPAPSSLPAFMPFHVANKRGYFAANNLSVTFMSGRGGADTATQVAVGNANLGGGTGETSMIVRPNGLPVRAVAQLGSHSLFQIVTLKEAGVKSIADLRGKKIGVMSYEDTSFYALLGALASAGLNRADLRIQAVGPAGMTQLMITKALDGTITVPEWADAVESAGVPLDYLSLDKAFPAMAQAILASDKIVNERPEMVRGFVQSMLRAVKSCIADPAAAAADFVAAVPQHAGKEAQMERILRRYVDNVYKTEPASALGSFDLEQAKAIQKFYVDNKIVQSAVPVNELYTNAFVS